MRNHNKFIWLCAVVFILAFAFAACGGRGAGRAPIPPATPGTSVQPDAETSVLLPSGGGVIFPAGSFTTVTTVEVSEDLTAAQRDGAGFPPDSGAMLGATRLEVPAGRTLLRDVTVRIGLSQVVTPGTSFVIFRFNEGTHMWDSTENTASALRGTSVVGSVGSSGYVVSFIAPTEGESGLSVAYAVFENYAVGGAVPDVNHVPTVSLEADSTSVDPGVEVTLTATGTDADGDALEFSWLAAGGTLGSPVTAGGTSTVTWSASDGGMYSVSVSASDGRGGVATDAVAITVTTPGAENNPPVITDPGISSDVSSPYATQLIIFSAEATDEDHDELTFAWSDDTGGNNFFDESMGEHGAQVWWNYDTAGSYVVTLEVSDGMGGTDIATFDVTLAELPASYDWVGYEGCFDACHGSTDVTQAGWLTTAHANAFENSLNTSAHGFRNESCYGCHAVGYEPTGEGGFISEDVTPQFANIQCESCHGTGIDHPAGGMLPKPWNPGTGYEKDVDGNYVIVDGVYQYDEAYDGSNGYGCGLCHEGSRHGSFEEWAESGHANLELWEDDGEGGLDPNHAITGTSCSRCHNGAEFVNQTVRGNPAEEILEEDYDPDIVLIGCATCHDPHTDQYAAQLRIDSAGTVGIPFSDTDDVPTMIEGGLGNICITCHEGRRDRGDYDSRIWSGSGHFGPHGNPQGPMLFGIMGADLGNPATVVDYDAEHAHETWNEDSCVTCHMYRKDYESSDSPALWGHNFEARFERCITCHSNFSDETEFWGWVEDYEAEIDVLLQAFVDAWPTEWKDVSDPENPVLENRDTDPPTGVGPPRDDEVGAAYRAALWNYMLVLNDASHGIHNPSFTISLLEEATASVIELNGG